MEDVLKTESSGQHEFKNADADQLFFEDNKALLDELQKADYLYTDTMKTMSKEDEDKLNNLVNQFEDFDPFADSVN